MASQAYRDVIGEEPFHITPMGSSGGRGPVFMHDFDMIVAGNVTVDITDGFLNL